MKRRKQFAAALSCALVISLSAGAVLADGMPNSNEIVDVPEVIAPAPTPESALDLIQDSTDSTEAAVPDAPPVKSGTSDLTAQPDSSAASDLGAPGTLGAVIPESSRVPIIVDDNPPEYITPAADKSGTVSFENLESRLRKNNLNILSLDQNIEAIDAVDLGEMKSNLKKAITMLIEQQRQMQQLIDGTNAAFNGLQGALTQMETGLDIIGFQPAMLAYPTATIYSLETQIQSYQNTLDQLEDGYIANEYAAASSQLETAQDQIVMGAETLYISLLGLDQTAQGLNRNLSALDRTLAELEIRYDMGQISALTLAEAKAGRTSLVSGIATLDMNRTALKRQLEAMLGEEITGTIQLQSLHGVTAAQVQSMNPEQDLKQAKRASYELQAASKAWDDADYKYASLRDVPTTPDYEIMSAQYNSKAAHTAYRAAIQNFELKFATAYDAVHDHQQILNAAKTSLAVKEDNYAAAQIKYEQGTISLNQLLAARDAMEDAQDTVDTAAVDFFTAYNNYRWAVDHGILN